MEMETYSQEEAGSLEACVAPVNQAMEEAGCNQQMRSLTPLGADLLLCLQVEALTHLNCRHLQVRSLGVSLRGVLIPDP